MHIMKKDFSVLMSVYYKENPEYLKMSLDSIINQTLVPNEIVLVEDGPLTDELNLLVETYQKKYKILKVIKLEKNSGLGIALNEGLKHCSCEYVARMDSDDISLPNRFQEQVSFITEHQDVDVVGSNIIEFDNETSNDLNYKLVPLSYEEIKKYIKKRNPMNHMTVFFKKSSVIDSGSYMNCPLFEDYFLWARMIANGYKLANIEKVLLRVRSGLNMYSRRGSISYIKCIINFQNELLKLHIINIFEYFYNLVIRISVSLLPNKMRSLFYQKKLRKKTNTHALQK